MMQVISLNRLTGGFNFLLARFGKQISLRNPVKKLTDPDREWYTTFEYYTEHVINALPVSLFEKRLLNRARYRMQGSNVGAGVREWAFIKGDEQATTESFLGYGNSFYPVQEVWIEIYDGFDPLVQHVVVGT